MGKPAILFFVLLLIIGCKKDNHHRVSDSIFGTYLHKNPNPTGVWWEDFLGETTIKVSPVNSTFIKIITGYPYPLSTRIFDSVKLISPKSFLVNQVIQEGFSPTGHAIASGSGDFGAKAISLNFLITLNDTLGNPSSYGIVIVDAEKISD